MNHVVNQPNNSPQLTDTQQMMLYMSKKKSALIAYLLWFIGGGLGAHRFYLRSFGMAATELALFIFGLLIFIPALPIAIILLFFWGICVIIDLFFIPSLTEKCNISVINTVKNISIQHC